MSDEAKYKEVIRSMNELREKSGINIDGKLYSQVKDRIEMFRTMFGSQFGISTRVDYSGGFDRGAIVVAHAQILDRETGVVMGSGHAMNFFGSNDFTTTAIVEATETNAIGRALATMGFAGGEFASAGEMTSLPNKREGAAARMSDKPQGETNERAMPALSQYNHYVPLNNSPDELDKGFAQIDAINDDKELVSYYYAIEKDVFPLLKDDMRQEFINSFKYRKSQLKG